VFKERSKLFYRYLISYLVVLIVPIVIIYAYFYASFVNILKAEEIENYSNAIAQTRIQLDKRLNEIEKISLQISLTPMIAQLPANGFQLREELKKYEAVNELSSEIILYIHGQDRLYSSRSSYTLDTFLRNIYNFKDWNMSSFYDDMNEIREPLIRPAEHVLPSSSPNDKLVTYLMPFPINSFQPYGTIMFMLKESAFKQVLGDALSEQNFNAVILDQDKNIITSLAQKDYMDSPEFRAFLAGADEDGTKTIRLLGEEYVAVHSASINTPLSYVFLIPSSVVMDKVSDVQVKMTYMLVIVLIAGFFIIYWLMHVNYDPVKELVKLTSRAFGGGRPLTELDAIRAAFSQMEETTQFLSRKVENSQPIIREHLIYNLLNGKIVSAETLEDGAVNPVALQPVRNFVVAKCVFHADATRSNPPMADVLDDLRDKLPPTLLEFGSYVPDGETLILILSTDDTDGKALEEQLTMLHHYLTVQWNVGVTVGVGNVYSEFKDISKSYVESSTAVDYLLITGVSSVSHFSRIDFVSSVAHWYPDKHLESLDWYLQSWDVDKIEKTLREIAERVKQENIPIYLVKCLCFNIINMLIRRIYQVKLEKPNLREDVYDVVSLTQFKNIDELVEEVTRICREVVKTMDTTEVVPEPPLAERMMVYIKTHYCDPNFTIYSVAQHFAITPAYLRRVFKRQMGITVSEYVDSLRIEHAIHLLKESDETLSQIVVRIGYLNVSSFIRKFRQQVGMTPGEYRGKFRP